MELRKNPNIDLERKRGMFFSIGLSLSMLLVLTAFEWRTKVQPSIPDFEEEELSFEALYEPVVTEINLPPKPELLKRELKNPVIIVVPNDEILAIVQKVIVSEPEVDFDKLMIAEAEPVEPPTDEFFEIVEKMPEPYGGMTAFMKFLGAEIKYPRIARQNHIEGRVFAQFIIDEEGQITQLKIIKGIGGGCDEEALRVIAMAPDWKPGKQRGRAVKVRMIVPVHFRLH